MTLAMRDRVKGTSKQKINYACRVLLIKNILKVYKIWVAGSPFNARVQTIHLQYW
jgi:hypothetical protein